MLVSIHFQEKKNKNQALLLVFYQKLEDGLKQK